jgi:hypothetical protein
MTYAGVRYTYVYSNSFDSPIQTSFRNLDPGSRMKLSILLCLCLLAVSEAQMKLRTLSSYGLGYDNACFHGSSDDYAVVSATQSNLAVSVPADSGRLKEIQRIFLDRVIAYQPVCVDSTVIVRVEDNGFRIFAIGKDHRLTPKISTDGMDFAGGRLAATDKHLAILHSDSIFVAADYRAPGFSWTAQTRFVEFKYVRSAVMAGDFLLVSSGSWIHRIPMDPSGSKDSLATPGANLGNLAFSDGILFGSDYGLHAYQLTPDSAIRKDLWQPFNNITSVRVGKGGWVSASAGSGNSMQWTRFVNGAFDVAAAKNLPTGSEVTGLLGPGGYFLEVSRNSLSQHSPAASAYFDFPIGYSPLAFATSGEFMLVRSESNGNRVRLMDFRDRTKPVLAGTFSGFEPLGSVYSSSSGGAACGEWVFLSKPDSYVYGFRRTPEGNLEQRWRYEGKPFTNSVSETRYPSSLACNGEYLVVAGESETAYFKLQGLAEPQARGKLPGAYRARFQGDKLLLTYAGANLWTLDVNGASPEPVPLWKEGSILSWGMLGDRAFLVVGDSIREFDAATGTAKGAYPAGCGNGDLVAYRDFILVLGCGDSTRVIRMESGKTAITAFAEPALKGRRIIGINGPLLYATYTSPYDFSNPALECILDENGPPIPSSVNPAGRKPSNKKSSWLKLARPLQFLLGRRISN